MSVYNFTKLVREYFANNPQINDSRCRDLRDDDIVLSQLMVKVKGEVTWTKMPQNTAHQHQRTVDITPAAGVRGAYGQVQTVKDSNDYIHVTIDSGVCKGLNRRLKLQLDAREPDLIKQFGVYLEIDPSKIQSQPLQNKVTIGVSVEGDLGAGASATVRTRENHYEGQFRCTIVVEGKCLAIGYEIPIGDIIDYLQGHGSSAGDLTRLIVVADAGKKAVEFEMIGELIAKWNFGEEIDWK